MREMAGAPCVWRAPPSLSGPRRWAAAVRAGRRARVEPRPAGAGRGGVGRASEAARARWARAAAAPWARAAAAPWARGAPERTVGDVTRRGPATYGGRRRRRRGGCRSNGAAETNTGGDEENEEVNRPLARARLNRDPPFSRGW